MVSLPLWYTDKWLGSASQKCLQQSNLWLSRLNSCPTVAFRIVHLPPTPVDITLNHQATRLLLTDPTPPCKQFPPTTASLSFSTIQIKETLLEILLLITGKPSSQRKTVDLILIRSPLDPLNFTGITFIKRLLPLRPRPIRCCSRLSSKSPNIWCSRMDHGSAPSPFGFGGAGVQAVCRRCSSSSSLSNLAGPVSFSFSAESLPLVHSLK